MLTPEQLSEFRSSNARAREFWRASDGMVAYEAITMAKMLLDHIDALGAQLEHLKILNHGLNSALETLEDSEP